jgi:hypothetical protein
VSFIEFFTTVRSELLEIRIIPRPENKTILVLVCESVTIAESGIIDKNRNFLLCCNVLMKRAKDSKTRPMQKKEGYGKQNPIVCR